MKLLYLHGFRSSPQSAKAQRVQDFCASQNWDAPIIPQLPISPKEAIDLCENLIAQHQISAVCGSSLGGFYALYLAEKYGLRGGLINPAISPWIDLERADNHVRYDIDALDRDENSHYVEQLKPYFTPKLSHPERFFLLVGAADEVLDARQAINHLDGARQIVVPRANHAITDFGGHLAELMLFLSAKD